MSPLRAVAKDGCNLSTWTHQKTWDLPIVTSLKQFEDSKSHMSWHVMTLLNHSCFLDRFVWTQPVRAHPSKDALRIMLSDVAASNECYWVWRIRPTQTAVDSCVEIQKTMPCSNLCWQSVHVFCHFHLVVRFLSLSSKASAYNIGWVNCKWWIYTQWLAWFKTGCAKRQHGNEQTPKTSGQRPFVSSFANRTAIVASPPTDLFQARKWQPRLWILD